MPYSGNPGDTPADEVRFLLGDTSDTPRLSDEEVAWLLAQHPVPIQAAYQGALRLFTRYSGRMSKSVGPTSLEYGSLVQQYESLMKMLARMGGDAGTHRTIKVFDTGGQEEEMWSDVQWTIDGD